MPQLVRAGSTNLSGSHSRAGRFLPRTTFHVSSIPGKSDVRMCGRNEGRAKGCWCHLFPAHFARRSIHPGVHAEIFAKPSLPRLRHLGWKEFPHYDLSEVSPGNSDLTNSMLRQAAIAL